MSDEIVNDINTMHCPIKGNSNIIELLQCTLLVIPS